jgi:hypothetical protein
LVARSLAHLRQHSVGYLALFVALAGTSYAAVNLPKHSIGAAQLKKAAVGTRQLRNGSVTQPKVNSAPGSRACTALRQAHLRISRLPG